MGLFHGYSSQLSHTPLSTPHYSVLTPRRMEKGEEESKGGGERGTATRTPESRPQAQEKPLQTPQRRTEWDDLQSFNVSVTPHIQPTTRYTPIVFIMILNHALSGIAVSLVMKFADNIVKVYSTSVAMVLTTLVSIPLFGFRLTLPFVLGTSVTSVAVFLHYQSKAK